MLSITKSRLRGKLIGIFEVPVSGGIFESCLSTYQLQQELSSPKKTYSSDMNCRFSKIPAYNNRFCVEVIIGLGPRNSQHIKSSSHRMIGLKQKKKCKYLWSWDPHIWRTKVSYDKEKKMNGKKIKDWKLNVINNISEHHASSSLMENIVNLIVSAFDHEILYDH